MGLPQQPLLALMLMILMQSDTRSWTGTGSESRPIDTLTVNRGGEHRGVDDSKKPLRARNVAFLQNHQRLGVIYPRDG